MNNSCRPQRALLALAFLLAFLAPQVARADSLTLAWDPNPESGVIGYYVYVGTAPGVYSATIDVGNSTTYTVASAVPGTTYYMTVAAYAAGSVIGPRAPEVAGATTSAPTLTNPGDRTSPKDVALSLSLLASTSTGTVTFNASGLPIGLSLNASTGVIAGTPSAAGVYTVAVTASDASGKTAIQSFMWTIVASNAAPTLSITSPTSSSTYSSASAFVTLSGTAGDDLAVTAVRWANSLGGSGTAAGTSTWSVIVPLQTGTNRVSITAADAAGQTATATLTVTLTSTVAATGATFGGCRVLPANNIWNTPIDALPVLANSATMVNTIGATRGFHADFGAGQWDGAPIGIPFVMVSGTQTKYPAAFLYASESDPGPYAVPLTAPIEGGSASAGDRHAIALDTTTCRVYELYRAFPGTSAWTADSGAIVDLTSNALRPEGWTSADAAGLPVLPGLVTYDEVASGEITHAIRFTAPQTRREYVWPARHFASSLTGTQYPRMGERFRLKASFDISGYPADVQVILRAMKKYGIILADNGSGWFISGAPDPRWNDDNLRRLGEVLGSNFEAVDATVLRISADSGAAIQSGVSVTVSPATASVRLDQTQTFTATLTGAAGGVTWSVNNVIGGDALVGTIDSAGRYVPPSAVPVVNVVVVRATSVSTPTASGSASVTLLPVAAPPPPPPPAPTISITVSPTSATVRVRGSKTFSATVLGTTNTATTWKVNGVVGGNSAVGTISRSGTYRAPNAVPSGGRVTVSATSVADPARSATSTVTIRR